MDDLTVKLTDYALSRDLFPQDYTYLRTDNPDDSRPLKFMAIESIQDRRFSTASDVVSRIHHCFSNAYVNICSGPTVFYYGN
jgi:hypothetical protein